MPNRIEGDLLVTGNVAVGSMSLPSNAVTNDSVSATAAITRSKLEQETLADYMVPWEAFKVWNAYQTPLPGTPLTDDLGLVGGTFGSASPSIQTEDLKAAGATTSYARFAVQLPPEYVDGETVVIRCHAGMLTTVADTSATLDVECYESNSEAGIGSDLCATSATSINSVTLADKDFTITASGLSAGDWLDVRLTVTVTDAATGTAVKALIGRVSLCCDIKG
jgi:hypothetical protein